MDFAEAIRFGIEALRANKLRTFLTALGLIIGNASVILVVTISLASQDMILNTIRGIGSNLVFANYETAGQNVSKVAGDFVKIADVNALREDLGNLIVAATAVLPNHDQIVVNGQVREVTVDGVDAEYAKVRNLDILKGRAFVQSDITFSERVAMVSQQLATRLFGGQEAAIGQIIKINQLQFTVIGTFRERTSTFGQGEIADETILIPTSVMKDFEQYERVEPVYLEARTAADVPLVRERVAEILAKRHRPGATYVVQDLQGYLDAANKIATVLSAVLVIVSAIALVISGIGIMNIMLVTVTERTREIGLRMALGASRGQIMLQFLVEAVMISVAGGAIGIVIGLALPLSVRLFTDQVNVPISPLSVVVAFAVSFTVGVGFGLLPARRAAELNPTEALRYE
ncbi:MAG: ABC transporter permease [Bryobacteraceae bacterium]